MTHKSGNEVKVGDTLRVWFNGGEAQVKALHPYRGPLLDLLGEGSQIASFHACPIEMSLSSKSQYEIA